MDDYSSTFLNRSEFVITETELKLIAAAAMIGAEQYSKERIKHSSRDRYSHRVIDEGEEQVLLDVA